MIPAVCDVIHSIASSSSAYQYVSPLVLAITMVSLHDTVAAIIIENKSTSGLGFYIEAINMNWRWSLGIRLWNGLVSFLTQVGDGYDLDHWYVLPKVHDTGTRNRTVSSLMACLT